MLYLKKSVDLPPFKQLLAQTAPGAQDDLVPFVNASLVENSLNIACKFS